MPRSFGRSMVTGPVVVFTVVGQWPFAAPGAGTLAMGVALAAHELGDLGLDGALHEQAHAEAGHLLQHLAQVTVGGEQVVDVDADALEIGIDDTPVGVLEID